MELKLNKENFDATVGSGTTLVDFWATWCGPCKMLAPTIEELSKEYKGRVKVAKLDVDENPDLAEKFAIYSIPTLLIFKDGVVKERLTGYRVKSQISEYLDKYL